MKARWVGVLAVGTSVLLGAAPAAAGETKELGGKVIKSEANTIYLDHMGAVVPMEIARHTTFSGVRSAVDLAEGQEVRASFTVKNGTKNVADTVSVGAASSTKRAPEPEPEPEFTDRG